MGKQLAWFWDYGCIYMRLVSILLSTRRTQIVLIKVNICLENVLNISLKKLCQREVRFFWRLLLNSRDPYQKYLFC